MSEGQRNEHQQREKAKMKVLRSRSLAFQHDALGEEAEKAAKKAAKKRGRRGPSGAAP